MLGLPCLLTEKRDFIYQDSVEGEKTIGIHSGYIKKSEKNNGPRRNDEGQGLNDEGHILS